MSDRKEDHIRLALGMKPEQSDFDDLRVLYDGLVDLNLADVQLTTHWLNHEFPIPLYINAMTGGVRSAWQINHDLACVAAHMKIPMAVGSMHRALVDPVVADTYTVIRDVNPDGVVIANLGAYADVTQARRAIDMIHADAIQIHLNVPQEMIMPEGDRDFAMWQDHIQAILAAVDVPVIVKDVGFGMSHKTYEKLLALGVTTIDVAGRGGTNFIEIEDRRRDEARHDYLYDFGQTTVQSLLLAKPYLAQADFLASGGIRNPYDALKCLMLGAQSVGLAGMMLRAVVKGGVDEGVRVLSEFSEAMRMISAMHGAVDLSALKSQEIRFIGNTAIWRNQSGVLY